MKISAKIIYTFFLLVVSFHAHAIDFKSGEVIAVDSTINSDAYIAGKSITINGPVRGDLICAAQQITINDSIGGDIAAASETVLVIGNIVDDIRILSRTFTLKGNVKGDVILFCADAFIQEGSVIDGDLIVFSGNVIVEGSIKGNILIRGGKVVLKGNCEGGIEIKAEELTINSTIKGPSVISAQTISIGPDATFSGQVRYWQKAGAIQSNAAKFPGGLVYDPSLSIEPNKNEHAMWFAGLGFVIWHLLFGLLLIILIQLLFPLCFSKAATHAKKETLKSFGLGIVYFIVVPVISLMLLITIIGIPIALLLIPFYIFTLISGLIITSIVIAHYINLHYEKNWSKWAIIGISFLILLGLHFILLIPIVGFLASVFLVATAFGGLLLNLKKQPDPVS